MVAKLTRLTQKIATQLHTVAESCTICSSRSRRPVRKLLDIPSFSGFVTSLNGSTYFFQRVVVTPAEISRLPHFGTLRVDETKQTK